MISVDIKKKLHSPKGQMELNVGFSIEPNEFCILKGPSGAGKTTLLKIIAGLRRADSGSVKSGNTVWSESASGTFLSPSKRRLGFVFQDYALFPNMTVRENLNYALGKNENKEEVDRLLDLMELGSLDTQNPYMLSGGQQQRVALARAIIQKPQLLLLDEPLSAVDETMRQILQRHLSIIHEQYNLTTVMVSHDEKEIIRLADSIIELNQGTIIKKGKRSDFYGENKVEKGLTLTAEILEVLAERNQLKLLIGSDIFLVDNTHGKSFEKWQLARVTLGDNGQIIELK